MQEARSNKKLFHSKFFILVSCFLFLSSCFPPVFAAAPNPPAYDPNYSSDQIFVVDSFSKPGLNNLGHSSRVNFLAHTKTRVSYVLKDAINGDGQSLNISFTLFGTNEISWTSELHPLDLSAAQILGFWFKGTWGTLPRISVSLTDLKGQTREIPIRSFVGDPIPTKKNWRPVLIPIEKLRGLDYNHLTELKIIVRSGFFGLLGQVSLDDVYFVGPKDIYFESLKDNYPGFPKILSAAERRKALLEMKDPALLREIARDTWKYFANLVDHKTHLVIDNVKLDEHRSIGDYTSPTNIGLYLISCVAAYHLGFISREDSVKRIEKTLNALENLKQFRNFFYNFYNTTYLDPTSTFISTVDNAWLAAGLVITRGAFRKELHKKTTAILNLMDFEFFYDPGVGQMSLGYETARKELLSFHYSLLASEARIASLIAIGKHDVPREHWFQIFRTPPAQWKWQTQAPKEKNRKLSTYELRTGFYTYGKRRFVPSWGGSLFEFLMPTLVIPEKIWSPEALGLNNEIVSELHRDYALLERKYPVWGISPCSVARGKTAIYREFGIKALGVKGYNDAGVITPHVSFLALETIPLDAIKNIRQFLKRYDIYGEYGFFDSVQPRSKIVTRQYLALDQGMILIALANYLNNGSIQQLLANDEVGKEIRDLLKEEDFF